MKVCQSSYVLKINLKCIFAAQELTFAGFTIPDKGIVPDSFKVNAAANAKVSTNATKVCSLLELVN